MQANTRHEQTETSNRLLVKGLVTGLLILAMLIPTLFVNNLVQERQERQQQVVQEVSSKWASSQRVSGIYLVVPYTENIQGADGKILQVKKNVILLPETISTTGKIIPEEAHRSIYHVLLYRSELQLQGSFNIQIPDDIQTQNLDLGKTRVCIGITDFKGIEEKITVKINSTAISLNPGLPTKELDQHGLSAPVPLTAEALQQPITFSTSFKLKGSERLHFLPLAANSEFNIHSAWENPSFDGNSIPNSRSVNQKGFTATWHFNQANLPFSTVIQEGTLKDTLSSFGVSMLQPADQYGKTMRSIKYAILFIGLTFALFFIVELMQQKPFHPVQYVLVGLALIIFYTLLLSISEFVRFDLAYLVAATATVTLIALYAKSHFQSWKTASLFALVLGALYGFIFILIGLEDTALLVGSIGLFVVLALVMYASRKVNWYGHKPRPLQRNDVETV
jgi:inner membrane protein